MEEFCDDPSAAAGRRLGRFSSAHDPSGFLLAALPDIQQADVIASRLPG
jgi:hypothetical protein